MFDFVMIHSQRRTTSHGIVSSQRTEMEFLPSQKTIRCHLSHGSRGGYRSCLRSRSNPHNSQSPILDGIVASENCEQGNFIECRVNLLED
jgi:hypothetical protein